jgi:hypothetical protein
MAEMVLLPRTCLHRTQRGRRSTWIGLSFTLRPGQSRRRSQHEHREQRTTGEVRPVVDRQPLPTRPKRPPQARNSGSARTWGRFGLAALARRNGASSTLRSRPPGESRFTCVQSYDTVNSLLYRRGLLRPVGALGFIRYCAPKRSGEQLAPAT